jgi:AraC-like DNA-binding protein
VARQVIVGGPAAAPHHGPVRQDCPLECLQAVLSQAAYRPLALAQGTLLPPPRTVGDVIGLYARRDLRDIRGLGPRRISEIEAALILAGFDLSVCLPPSGPPAATPTAGDPDGLPGGGLSGCPVCGALVNIPLPQPPQASACTKRRARQAERTAWVIAWMAANVHRPDVQVAEVAEVAGVSVNRLQAIFRRDVGRRPLQLMADMRLHRVHRALTGQAPAPASLAEAARLAGHSRVTRFRDAYRARYGTNPALPGQAAVAARSGTAKKARS